MGNFNLLKDVIVTFFWFSTFLEHSFGELYTLFQEKMLLMAMWGQTQVLRWRLFLSFRLVFSSQLPPIP